MVQTTVKTGKPSVEVQGQRIILRPKSLTAGLQPEYTIDHFPATIGRHPVNDVALTFDSISRYHARLEFQSGHLNLVDLRSSNGTFVNGKRVQVAIVADHDAIAFGSVEFTVILAAREEKNAPAETQEYGSKTRTSVHFVTRDEPHQSVFHTDLPDQSSHASMLQDEITDAQTLKKAKQRLVSLYKLQEVLHTSGDEERIFRSVLTLLFDILPVDRGVILTRDEADPGVFRPAAIKLKTGMRREKIGISKTILQRCLKEKVAVLTRDACLDSRFKAAESVVEGQMRSVMCVPLISARHFFGFCHLDTTDSVRSFTEDDLAYLAHIGQVLATHLHNQRMIQEKIQSERMAAIGQTITGMAHNIKNILVLSQGGVEMMEKRLHERSYDTLDETWTLVRRGVERINRLVHDMLEYSKARKVVKSRVDLGPFLGELKETFAEEMNKRQIECRLELDESIPALMLDEDGLEKAVVNLIVNAMEAHEERPGTIGLRTRQAGEGRIAIDIADTGGGIPKEVLSRIFVPFFTTKGSKGSGLGLAMTKKIIEDMGGTLDVKSTDGVGACFTITLQVGPIPPQISPTQGGVVSEEY